MESSRARPGARDFDSCLTPSTLKFSDCVCVRRWVDGWLGGLSVRIGWWGWPATLCLRARASLCLSLLPLPSTHRLPVNEFALLVESDHRPPLLFAPQSVSSVCFFSQLAIGMWMHVALMSTLSGERRRIVDCRGVVES